MLPLRTQLPYTLLAFRTVISKLISIWPILPTLGIMPSISNFGYSIMIRHQQYSALWMHTLSLYPTHLKTGQNDTTLSQTEHGQTSPTLTPISMGLLSLQLYGDVRLVTKSAKKIGMPLPGANPCFQIFYSALTFPHTPYMLTRVSTKSFPMPSLFHMSHMVTRDIP
jgi:hypothetical protein